MCSQSDHKYHDLTDSYNIDIIKNKIKAFTYFSNINDFTKFSNNIFFMDCKDKHKIIINNNNNYGVREIYNFINKNIQEKKTYELKEIKRCLDDTYFINS